jgi:hypothetical protein
VWKNQRWQLAILKISWDSDAIETILKINFRLVKETFSPGKLVIVATKLSKRLVKLNDKKKSLGSSLFPNQRFLME